ncbi:bacterial Ig-like domain-containing protein [Lactiplantibacillus pentosus]|uniref:bacterial Ig-like domain-containing protein n=1 Tax=Lactiplantibacillus pentosus TaxID=1589 RepID=UPI003C1E9B49
MKNNQEYVMMAARKNRRFWLAAGTALLVWQVNNQTAQADVQQTPMSSADTTVVTANATAASNVVQLQSGAKTSTKTTSTAETTKTESTSPQQAGSDSQVTSASGTASSAAKTVASGQAASDLTTDADDRAKSESTTPYTDGINNVEIKQNTTTVATSADKSATGSQSTTETGTTPAQSVETDKAGSAGDSVPVAAVTKVDQANNTILSNDGYDTVNTDVNSSQLGEADKTGTNQTGLSTDEVGSQTVTDEKTSAGLTADSLSSLQPRLAQVQASSLQLDAVDATPTVAQDYAAWDAITDTSRKGILGTSEWWIDDSDNTLHLGAGQLADANVQFDDNAEVTDWGNVGWGQYVEAHDAKLTLLLEGSVAVGANARGLFNGLTFDLSNEEYPRSFFSQISVKQTTDMSYMFERATFMASGVFLNDWYSLADSVNASHMFENVKCISNASQYDKRVLATLPDLAEAYSDTSYMFNNSGFSSIAMASDASDASKLTSQVTSMAYMFNNCTQLMSLDLSKFDTHNVTDMSHMFNGDENLGKLVISTYSPNNPDQTFDTRNVTNMSHMFTRCDALGNLDVSGFITSKVTNMSHMFDYCYATTLDVANFDTSQVTDMQAMFNGAVHVKTLDLSNFDTHLITNMDNMFTSCESLTSLILPTHFVDQQVTSMKQMFTNCATLTSIDLVDAFDTSNVTNMDQLFSGCQKLTSLDVSQLDTSHITNMADFFNDCESLTNIEGLTHLNTAAVTTMANMFSNCRSLTALDLSNFETSRVTTMANMFNNCASLPALDVSSLDTSQVVNMANMFAGCAALSALDTTPLKTTNVTNMSGMFKGDRALVSLDISKLGTGQVTTMSHMFEDVFADQKAQSFTGLEKLDTSNVTDMSYMFAGFFLPVAMSLNLVNFDTRKVLNMQGMFKGYVNFKDNYLSYLQTGNVTDMSYMLSGLVNHTQFTWSDNLDTHSVTTMAYMFSDSPDMETFVWKQQLGMDQVTNMQGMFANDIALVNVNFEQFDTSQVTDMTAMFSGDTRLERLDLTSFDTSNVQHMYKMFYLDSALKNLNLSSFSGEKLQFNYPTVWALFGLFNLPIVVDSDGNQQIGQYQTYLSTLTLGCKTRLSLPKPTSIVDWFDTSQVSQEEIQEILATFPTVEALEEALAESGLKPDWLVSADLAPSQGFDGVWINNATAETLTSEQLMARYDGTNPLATDATWTWQNILGKDLQVISGTNSTWAPKDSLAGLIDTSKTVDDLTTTVTDTATNQTLTSSQLNALLQQPAHSGQYQVAYQYIDGDGTKQISVPVTLSLVTNQSLITAKDSVLQLGTTWIAADNIASLLDADGSVTDLTKVNGVVSVNGIENGTVDTAIPGIYQIDYQITDSTGTVRTATATVIVNGLTLKETQVNVSTDDRWDPLTNIAKAIDDQGNEATVELTITDANDVAVANIKKPGTYQLNYHFTDAHGEHTATAAVNVKADENHADLQVKDSRVYQFGTWTSTDNFVSAMDSDGETLDISALSVTGTVDLNQVGKYTITYQFTDQFGVAHSAQATVEVLENQAAINIDNNSGTLYANGIWNPASVVVNATDVDGTVVEDSEIKRSGTVDVTTPGDYKLTYSFVDSLGEEHSKDTTVTVLENLAGIKVKSITESFRIGAKWSEENNFDSATDVDGTSVDLSNVAIESTVNSEVVGQYKVTCSFTDQQGQLRSIVVPVEVLANLADIRVKSKTESFRIGAKWSAEDNFDSATDVDGTSIDLADVDVVSTVDPKTVGQYKVTYSFTDQQGRIREIAVPVEVLANLADIRVKSTTESFRIGAKWSAEDNFDSATDVDGTSIDLADVDVVSTVDPKTVGQYKVTYSFTDQQGRIREIAVPVEVLANLADIRVKSKTESFRIGAKWSAEDNFDSATDVDGTPLGLSNVDVKSTVNTEVVGQYKVTYSFTDQQGKPRSVEVPVEVLANLASIKVKAPTENFRIGAKWSEKDNFDSATDVDGTPIDLADVEINSTVDPEKVGQYKVTYSFTDQQGQLRQADVMVKVLENLAGIKVKSATESFRIGAKWSKEENFDSATDVDGTSIDLSDLDIISTVDSTTVGQYKVTYSFTDQQGKLRSVEVPVEVLSNLAGIKVKSTTESFRIGAKWSEKDNFDGATDVDGTPIDLADVDITSTVDPEKVGQYKVTYSFADQQGQLRQADATVKVLENLADIKVKSTTESFRIGAKWSEKDNFDGATDVDGSPIDLADVNITSTVDPTTVGQYKVTYSFTDQQGKLRSVEVPVEVLANMAGIKVKSKTESFRIGAKWSEKDNFDGATDVDGTPIDLADVDVISTVDPKTIGQYKVTYSFTDQQGELRSIEVPVEVLANLAGIKVKSTAESFRIGAKWSEEDNFDSATDVDGTPINLSNIDIESTVNSEVAGQYKVTYSFTDQQGKLRSAEIPVEVLANLAGIKVKSTTESFRIGAKWSEKDNFDSATDVDGTPINLSNIDIESTVNSEVAGQYKVTYSFTDQQGNIRSVEVPVEVLANLAGIRIKSTTESFRIGAKWSAEDNFDSATNVDGTSVDLADVDIVSTVNPKTVGQYKVTYSFTDQQGRLQKVDVKVEVLANLAGIKVKSTTESFRIGAKWSEKDNFDGATDVDGTPIDLADVDVTSTVDPKTVGQYKVTYSFTDQQGQLRKADVKVEVLANLAGIKAKSTTESFRIGAKWSEEDNFDSATDVDGTPIDLADVYITSTVDPKRVGQYKVTYSFTDQQGQLRNADVMVEVLENLAGIRVKSTTESFRMGAKWSAKDNLDSATDVDGTSIDLTDVDITSTVDSKEVGQYKVTYSFTDQQGKLRSVEVQIEVLANLAGIKVKSATESFRIGAKWSEEDNFDSATDVDGTLIDLADVDITSTVDSKAVGQYKVTYSFTDQQGKLRSVEVPVEVLANLAGISAKSATESFRIGAKWSAKDNFEGATDVDGTPIDLADVDVTSTVDPEKVGQYKVTYSFTDQQGQLRKADVTVDVLANLAGIRVKSTTESFRIGAKWSEKDNFESATNVDGTAVALSDVDITSTVDPEKVGQYNVTYSFTDQQGQLRKADVTVDVLANLAGISAKSAAESFRIGAKWSAKDNFEGATDVEGTPIDLADVDITSTVDPEKVGQYKVTYSFTDQQGQLRKADVTVDVLANLAGIKVKSTTESFRIGAKWSAEDNFDSATDVDGTPIDLADVDITSTVDPEKVGQYKVTYSFTDQQGQLRKADVTIDVLANLAGIKVKSTTESFRIGAKWSAKDNFEGATDVDGTPIDLADVDIESTVNPEVVGQYTVTYSFTDQQGKLRSVEVPVEVLANLAGIKVKSTTESFRIGAKWSEKDNFDRATNVDGTPVDLADVDITSTVDSKAVGQYTVTYSFTDQQGTVQQVIVPVNVLANYANLQLNQTELGFRAGDNRWQPESNIAAATDIDGRAIDLATMQITNAVDSTTPGTYLVNYAFTDSFNQTHRATATVTVLDNLAALTMTQQHVTLYLGNRQWQPEDNFGGAKNVDGSVITYDQLQVLGHYDLKVVGDYELTYQFTDQLDHLRTAQFTVTVAENQATIVVEKTAVTLHVGDTWEPMMNFVSATDMDGQVLAEDWISVNVTKLNQRLRLMMMRSRTLPIVDTTVVGSYQVSYQFIDGNGNLQELATTVTVLPNESVLKLAANDITLYAGDEWQPMANVVKATNVDGTPVTADQIRISGSVNPNVVGQYRVLYSFVDQQDKLQQAVTTVNVLANQAALLLKHDQVALTVGDEWQPVTNLQLARDVDGHEIASTDLAIDGQVDTATPGTYQVRYHFTDMRGHEQQAVVMVTVVEPAVVDQALLRLHTETVTLRAGATWAPLSNVDEVLDSDGSAQTSEQVSVQGTVDLNQAGKYLLTYHFLDQLGHDHSATATIIVLENEASLKLRTTAVTLKVGQKWDAFANILAATDVDGRSINEAVVITGDVDWQHSGIYQLTYELVDQQGKLHSATTMITLIAADDDSGNQGGNGNTDNGSGNQGGNGNTDNGSGNQGGNGNTDNGSGNQGGNGNTNDGSSNQGGNGNTDNGSGNQDGNSDADNGSGNQDGNGNTDTNSDNQSTKADDDTVSNDNLNTNHQIDTDTIHDAGNNSGQKEVAKPNPVSHENGANATVKAAVAKHQSVTTASVKSTTNTNTNEQPSVGSPTQLPQTDEHNAGTTNWWPWLGIALAGLITMVKPTKKKEK